MKPICVDLFCGLGGWSDGFLAEGYQCWGFDIERHDYGTGGYPGDLVLQDVLTLHGSQFKDAVIIVASPPCQEYSYMAMPWSRAKAIAAEYRSGVRSVDKLNALFNACFRISKEADVPLIVENVRGAQAWVERPPSWKFGSFYLWGDVPALMPREMKVKGARGSWFYAAESRGSPRDASLYSLRSDSVKMHGTGSAWFDEGFTKFGSRSERRKAASAAIAKIPPALSRHIARVYKPVEVYA